MWFLLYIELLYGGVCVFAIAIVSEFAIKTYLFADLFKYVYPMKK